MENNTVVPEKETEVCIYGYIRDLSELSTAHEILEISQYSATLGDSGRCRCRSTLEKGTEDYVMTVKMDKADKSNVTSKYEYNFNVDKDYYDYFKTIAQEWHKKKRYIFKVKDVVFKTFNRDAVEKTITVPEVLYEVDIFEKEDGSFSNWCKIDIEIDKALDYIDSNIEDYYSIELNVNLKPLPVVVEDAFMASKTSIAVKNKISKLWEEEFGRKIPNG